MYSVWKYEEKEVTNNKRRAVMGRAQQERDRKANAIELTDNIRRQFQAELPPMTASEFLSMAFRQRGIPCMDSFTHQVIGKFRTALGYNDRVEGHERKFLPLIRWECPEVVGTLWTIEPVASSFIMRGNSTDCETALKQYEGELEVIDSMSMTSAATSAKVGNELWGRWAGWILWRAAIDNGGYTDSHPDQEREPDPPRDDACDRDLSLDLRQEDVLVPRRDHLPEDGRVYEAEGPAHGEHEQGYVLEAVRERVHAYLRIPIGNPPAGLGHVFDREEGLGDGPA
ncbi:hypothetical protein LTR02_017885 [Friedmanniomyces endolithicus]|nr:hypothetical protein LTR38_016988 [Friedmanniomyces endolithicus]KAK0776989.1 hypothetical protein LTR59_014018 [Friedmanniomyces endolithicus]KAK0787303.1 hypothetical protein LTR75_012929 [Friedmanniomyces endolithicus]KAK0886722.1 hypothetical protein LTR02_017885 [Friedmanniomyces endolithicus]